MEVLKVNYETRIRSILEYGCVVWGCVISGVQVSKVEKVQMNALQVILGAEGSSYNANLLRLGLDKLSVRRDTHIKKFAISTFHDPKFICWYKPSPLLPGIPDLTQLQLRTLMEASKLYSNLPGFLYPVASPPGLIQCL